MLTAKVQYIAEGEQAPVYYASSAGRNASFEVNRGLKDYEVEVHDAREAETNFGVEKLGQPGIGFQLVKHKSKVINFLDADEISGTYENEIEYILKTEVDVNLIISTLQGKLVQNIDFRAGQNGKGEIGKNFYQWDGRNKKGRIVEAGAYVIRLEIKKENRIIKEIIYVTN